MKRKFATAMTFVWLLALAWYSGVDFSERGFLQAWCVASATAFGILVYVCPLWRK